MSSASSSKSLRKRDTINGWTGAAQSKEQELLPERLGTIRDSLVDIGESSSSRRHLEENFDSLLLNHGDVEGDGEIVGGESESLQEEESATADERK